MPEWITGIGKSQRMQSIAGIKPVLLIDLYKCQVHVYIVIQSEGIVIPPFHLVFIPWYGHVIAYHGSVPMELGRPAVGAAYDLSGPAPQ